MLCFKEYNGNDMSCLLCPNNCEHIIDFKEYQVQAKYLSMKIEDFQKQIFYNYKSLDENLNQINDLNNNRIELLNKYKKIKTNIESKNIKFEYPFEKLITDMKNFISREKNELTIKKIDELNEIIKHISLNQKNQKNKKDYKL